MLLVVVTYEQGWQGREFDAVAEFYYWFARAMKVDYAVFALVETHLPTSNHDDATFHFGEKNGSFDKTTKDQALTGIGNLKLGQTIIKGWLRS